MKVIYDKQSKAYIVQLEDLEKATFLNTDDIVEARKYFIEHMTSMFNHAINERLEH
jgi:hexokinase